MISLKPLLKLKQIYCWFNFLAFHLARIRWNFCLASSGMGFQKKQKQFDASLYYVDCCSLVFLGGQLRDLWCIATSKSLVCIRSSTFRPHWKLFFLLHPFVTVSMKDLYFLCIEVLRPYDAHVLSLSPWTGFQYFPAQILLMSHCSCLCCGRMRSLESVCGRISPL